MFFKISVGGKLLLSLKFKFNLNHLVKIIPSDETENLVAGGN